MWLYSCLSELYNWTSLTISPKTKNHSKTEKNVSWRDFSVWLALWTVLEKEEKRFLKCFCSSEYIPVVCILPRFKMPNTLKTHPKMTLWSHFAWMQYGSCWREVKNDVKLTTIFVHTSNSGINIYWRSRHHDHDHDGNVNFSHREKVCISKLSNTI
jgi:hypothetical protein